MPENRNEQRAAQPSAVATLLAAETLRSTTTAGEPAVAAKSEERVSVFWRIFGATLLSIAALVVLTLCQHFNSSLNELRSDLGHVNEDLRKELGRVNEAHAELLKKEEFSFRMKSVWDGMKELREGLTNIAALKERAAITDQRLKTDEDEQKALAHEIQRLRELRAGQDGRTEMVGELQRLRERLAGVEGRQALTPVEKPAANAAQ